MVYLNRNHFKGMLITKELVGNDSMIYIYPNTVWILLTIYGLVEGRCILKRMMMLIYLSSLGIKSYRDWLCRVQMLTVNRDAL